MKISGFIKQTAIDYNGKIAAEVFTGGCNFRCGFCHNPDLVENKMNEIDFESEIFPYLKKSRGFIDGVVISGGEPTIYPDLPEFIGRLRQMGLSVKLDTNGSNPEMLRRLLKDSLVDYVAMDIKASRERYYAIVDGGLNLNDVSKSIKLVRLFPGYEFRTTVLPFFNPDDFEDIGKWISGNGDASGNENRGENKNNNGEKVRLYTLQQFSNKKTLDPDYMRLTPKPKQEIEKLGELMKKYAENVRVLV